MDQTTLFTYFPRVHTAIAEWLACLLFMLPLHKRMHKGVCAAICVAGLAVLLLIHMAGERSTGLVWIVLMVLGLSMMLLLIYSCCRVSLTEAVFHWSYAFMAAEFAASLEWQINYYLLLAGVLQHMTQTYVCMTLVYLLVFGVMFLLNGKTRQTMNRFQITWREALGAGSIAIAAFAMSNFNYAFQNNVFSESLGAGVLYTRTVIDFAGLVLLYAHMGQRYEMNLRFELDAMENLLNRQYEQYQRDEASNEALHRIYHDLKHQLAYLESESDAEKRASYLSEMKEAIEAKDAAVNTHNSVLDTLLTSKNLTCVKNGIIMRCYADAQILSFLHVMDICSIFGNALDNAIECEMKVTEADKRLISVDVYQENRFAVIRVANYCENPVAFHDEMPVTTKADRSMHGYGVKSIKRAAEKYQGHVTFSQEDSWFILTVLLPLPKENR